MNTYAPDTLILSTLFLQHFWWSCMSMFLFLAYLFMSLNLFMYFFEMRQLQCEDSFFLLFCFFYGSIQSMLCSVNVFNFILIFRKVVGPDCRRAFSFETRERVKRKRANQQSRPFTKLMTFFLMKCNAFDIKDYKTDWNDLWLMMKLLPKTTIPFTQSNDTVHFSVYFQSSTFIVIEMVLGWFC